MKKAANVVVRARECHGHHEKMIRKFIKKVKKERVLEAVKDRRYYKKPSVIKKEKQRAASRLRAREEQKRRKAQERRDRKK